MNGATALAVTYAGHMPRSAYERSKSVETIAWQEHPLARSLALRLLQESSGESRQAIGQALLHEWVHHYDFAGLRLDRSPHTSGFFARIRAVAETLGVGFVAPPKREASIGPLRAVDDVVPPGPSRLRPGGTDPPTWIRDQIAALFGRKEP